MRLSLRLKWTLALVFVGAAPLLLLATLGQSIQRRGLEENERALESAVVDEASEELSVTLDDLEGATKDVGRALGDPTLPPDARIALAQRAVVRARGLDYVAVYDPTGAFVDAIASGADRHGVDAPKTLDVKSIGAGSKLLPLAFGTHGADVFWCERMSSGETITGYALGRIDPDKLDKRVRALSDARFAKSDRLVLVDPELRRIAGGSVASGAKVPELATFGGLGTEGVAKTVPFLDASGTPMVGTLRTVPSRGLGVFVSRPESEAFAALADARRALVIASLGTILLAVALGLYLARRNTRPILSLVGLTERYARRDFTARSDVRSGDELETLATSMEGMATSLKSSEEEITRRAAVEASLSRYMPAEVARSIAQGDSKLALGGERRLVTVLFADVAGFTTFAESAPPEQVVAFLNELFTVLSEVVFRHGGMVDKFMGDCVMAIFGVDDDKEHAARAVRCAEDMHRFVEASAPAWKETYGFDVALGIGVACGPTIVGNLGSETRMEYTAIGDMVNVASRLEGLARPGQTLATADVKASVGDQFPFRSLGEQPIRGKRQAIEIFTLVE